MPVRVLGRVFRGKFLARMRDAFARGKLAGFDDAAAFTRWCVGLQSKEWVVYSKPPFGGPEPVLKDLARDTHRDTHRVAIGNSRLVKLDGGRVTFTYKDYADAAKTKSMTLDGVEFLRRWVQHVLPCGFVKIRHYGLLANRRRESKLALCRRLLLALGRWAMPRVPQREVRPDPCPVCGREVWSIGERVSPLDEMRCHRRVRDDSS